MNYCVKFGIYEVFANNYGDALKCAVALVKADYVVTIWQGASKIWEYDNADN